MDPVAGESVCVTVMAVSVRIFGSQQRNRLLSSRKLLHILLSLLFSYFFCSYSSGFDSVDVLWDLLCFPLCLLFSYRFVYKVKFEDTRLRLCLWGWRKWRLYEICKMVILRRSVVLVLCEWKKDDIICSRRMKIDQEKK